jgi:hypothetical protein
MATRFTGSGPNGTGYIANPGLGEVAQLSMTCWLKLSSDRNTNIVFVVLSNNSNRVAWIFTGSSGTSLHVSDLNLAADVGINATVGTWYFAGASFDGTQASSVYLDGASWTTQTWDGNLATRNADYIYLADHPNSSWLNGCLMGVKVWVGSALTIEQLQNEARSVIPKAPNVTAWYPLLKPETTDYSGNGYTLTGGPASTAIEDGPPISWGWPRIQVPIKDTIEIAVGRATSTETAGTILHQHIVGMALETSTARSTKIEVIADTVTEINFSAEIVDPIAVGVTALTSATAAASAQSWSTASVAPAGNRLVLLAVTWAASTAVVASPIASVIGNGLTWVLVRGQNYGAGTGTTDARRRMEIWRALGPAPTAGAITITHAASQPGINRCWSVFEMHSTDLSGTSGSGAIRQSASNRSISATTSTATLGAFGNAANATVGFGGGVNTMTVGTGFGSIAIQRVSTSPTVSLITEWVLGIDTTVNANQSALGQFGIIGIEIKYRFVEPLTGPPFSTNTAQAVTARKTKTLGQATETDTSRAVAAVRVKGIGQATHVNTAQVIVRAVLAAPVAQATETGAANAFTVLKTKMVGQASLTNTVQTLSRLKTRAVGLVTGTQTAQAIVKLKTAAVARASETTAAQALMKVVKLRAIGLASGTNAAQALTRVKTFALSRSTETGTARILTAVYVKGVGLATETEAARALATARVKLLGLVTETEAARSTGIQKAAAVGQIAETESARATTAIKAVTVGRVSEVSLARPVLWMGWSIAGVVSGSTTADTTGSTFVVGAQTYRAGVTYLVGFLWANLVNAQASALSTIAGTGVTPSLVLGANYGASTSRRRLEVWTFVPPADVTTTLTVTFGGSENSTAHCWSVVGANAATAGTFPQPAQMSRSTEASSVTATMGAFASLSNAAVGFFGAVGANGAMTAGSGFSSLHSETVVTGTTITLLSEYRPTEDVTIDATSGGVNDIVGIGIELKTSGAAVLLVARASSTEAARAFTAVHTRILGQATSAESSQALLGRKAVPVAQATEAVTARAFTAVRVLPVGQVVEALTARALVALKAKVLSLVAETAQAGALSTLKRVVIAAATGTDQARLIGIEKGLIRAVEPNHAQDVVSKPSLSAAVGQTVGSEAASPVVFVFTKVVAVGQVMIANVATGLTSLRRYPVTLAVESNAALTVTRLVVNQATETSTALTVTFTRIGTVVLGSTATGGARLGVEQAGVMLTSGPVGVVQTSIGRPGAGLTVERRGGVELTEGE